MKKILTWTFVSLLALLVMGLAVLQIISDSTASVEKAVIAEVRTRTMDQSKRPALSDNSKPDTTRALNSPAPFEDCEVQKLRWAALLEKINNAERPIDQPGARSWERYLYPDQYPDGDFGVAEVPPDYWSRVAAHVHSNAEVLAEFETLARRFNPDCGDLQQFSMPELDELSRIDHLLQTDMAFALYRKDYDSAMNNLRSGTALAYAAQGFGFPHRIEPRHVTIILEALAAGAVKDETWQQLLSVMRTFRNRDFILHYVRHYPHVPFGATVQESSYLKRAVRAAIHEIQEPVLNRDAVRFAPLVEKLVALAEEPYYEAKPELDKLVAEYSLRPHDRHSYSNESGARASVVNLIYAVFPRNALVQAQIDIFSLVIALERARDPSGAYPESLDAAVQCLGYPVPLNPFDGTPYRYEVTADSYRLGFELDRPALISALDRESTSMWVESVNGEVRVNIGE